MRISTQAWDVSMQSTIYFALMLNLASDLASDLASALPDQASGFALYPRAR